jgi:Protein of unknown function (DUF1698)
MLQFQIKSLAKGVKFFCERFPDALNNLAGNKKHVDLYCDQAPHPQNILDLFENEWVGKLPPPYDHLAAGQSELFNDSRLNWALEVAGDIKGKNILELGPLEGAHSYLLQKHGASVVAIEANPRAYMKCLAVKQILNLDQVQFLYGDFIKYLNGRPPAFDFCIACGVLYHMRNPIELIAQIAKCAPSVFMWTHYYDPEICRKHPKLKYNVNERFEADHEGFKHTLFKHHYGPKSRKKFFGGPAPYSHWLTREDILEGCKYFGFNRIEISKEHDTPHHVNGPSFAFVASR